MGDQLVSSQGVLVPIESISNLNEITTVYNLRVADHHTYFVGGALWGWDVWVHNAYRGSVEGLTPRHFSESPDGIRLFKEAREFRRRLPGSVRSKQYRNVAVADVIVDGQRRTVHFVNTPEIPDKQLGIHSEERLINWYELMKKKHEVKVLSIYSERAPCGAERANCIGKLSDAFGQDLNVYFNIRKGPIR